MSVAKDIRIEIASKIVERELHVHEMLLADPLTLQRIKAERIARAVITALDKMEEENIGVAPV